MNKTDSSASIFNAKAKIIALFVGLVFGFALGLLAHPSNFHAEKLLEWPFVVFVLLVLVAILFFEPLSALFSRGEFFISWGEDRSIQIRDLSSALDEELDPIRDDVETLKAAVQALQESSGATPSADAQIYPLSVPQLDVSAEALRRIRDALEDPQWRWRSIERLAALSGVTQQQALDIVRSQKDMVISIGKSGRTIARLRSK